jgi:hypothetical protein
MLALDCLIRFFSENGYPLIVIRKSLSVNRYP